MATQSKSEKNNGECLIPDNVADLTEEERLAIIEKIFDAEEAAGPVLAASSTKRPKKRPNEKSVSAPELQEQSD